VPRELFFPPGRTEKQVDEANLQDFKVSENTAEIAALRELRYPLEVAVARVLPNAAASGRLKAGDVITVLDGRRIASPDELVVAVNEKKPGESVTVTYLRGGASHTVHLELGTRPTS
jgi:PDZ domain-containing protein